MSRRTSADQLFVAAWDRIVFYCERVHGVVTSHKSLVVGPFVLRFTSAGLTSIAHRPGPGSSYTLLVQKPSEGPLWSWDFDHLVLDVLLPRINRELVLHDMADL